jgi:hypothetical protein
VGLKKVESPGVNPDGRVDSTGRARRQKSRRVN